jgi:hypothetical protein
MLTGVISTTRNVKIQFDAEAREAAGVRIANGAYSAGTLTVRMDGELVGGKTYEAMELPEVRQRRRN